MRSLTHCAESNLFLKVVDIENLRKILMNIPWVSRNKTLVSLIKNVGTFLIWKVELFFVMNKDIFFYVFYACNVATVILTDSGLKFFLVCVGYNLMCWCSPFMICSCFIVIAFDPEDEVTFSLNHGIINLLIFIKFVQVCNVTLGFAATNCNDNIQ